MRSVSGKVQQGDGEIMVRAEGSVGLEFYSPKVQTGFGLVAAALSVSSLAAQIGPIRGGVVVDLLQRVLLTPFETASATAADASFGILG